MSLDQLLYEATAHYRSRGFPESALVHLRSTLVANVKDDEIQLDTAHSRYTKGVEELVGRFLPCSQATASEDLSSADAVFGFAFGYRMKAWSRDLGPTDEAEVIANRVPGANNAVLAEQAGRLHLEYKLDLYLQFEIAAAVGRGVEVRYTSQRKDQGTKPVAKEFLSHAEGKIKTVAIVAHRHHIDRCFLVLEKEGIKGLALPDRYSGYDPFEAQPRVMSPEEFIVNDFVSMAWLLTAP